jgi:hypothetical protein
VTGMLNGLKFTSLPDIETKASVDFSGYIFETDGDGRTIKFSSALTDRNEPAGSFKTNAGLGAVLGIAEYGGKLLIIHELGFETLHISLDPSRFRLKTVSNFDRKIINLNQIRYRLKSLKRS